MSDSTIFNKGDEVSRRQFMIGAARNCLGVSVLPMLGSTIATNYTFSDAPTMRRGAAKSVIFLNMAGGMSHLDTFDPKPGREEQGETKAIKTKTPGVLFGEYLPNLAGMSDRLAVLRGMTTETLSLIHI